MFRQSKAEFAIINSFDSFDGFIFVLNYIRTLGKVCLWTVFFNKDKLTKACRKLRLLHYCGGNLYGHKSLDLSLIRGFKRLGIPFSWNKVNKYTKYVILLWVVNEKDLECIKKIKKKYPDIKIVTAPSACRLGGDYMYKFAELDFIDYSLVASETVKKNLQDKTDAKYYKKIKAWPSGVIVNDLDEKQKIHNAVLCYYKLVPQNKKITEYLHNKGISTYVLEYGAYQIEDYYDVLNKVDFVVFIQDIIETQGLAIAEAWAKNRPSIIKYNVGGNGCGTCPYLTKKTGMYYKTEKDLFNVIDEYVKDKQKFLRKFSPYKVAKEKFSDEASVKELIKIFQAKK